MGFVFKLCICSKLIFLNSPLLYCYNFAGVKICRTGDLLRRGWCSVLGVSKVGM